MGKAREQGIQRKWNTNGSDMKMIKLIHEGNVY